MLEFDRTLQRGQRNETRHLAKGLIIGVTLLCLSLAAQAASTVNSFTYTFKAALTNNGVDPDARGTVEGSLTRKGATDKQRLNITVTKLNTNTTYHVVAFVDESLTNMAVADFLTSNKGGASLDYNKGGHPGGSPLPDAVDPISNLRALEVTNGSGAIVLQADLTDPTTFSYSLKRAMDNTGFLPGAGGSLQLSGSQRSTKVAVAATGLTPLTSYQLQVNGESVRTNLSNSKGNLTITGPKTGVLLVLDIRTVALADNTGTNIILLTSGLGIPGVLSTAGQGPVVLRAAANYAVLAGSTITSINATTNNGDVGLAPGSAVTGFPPGIINGTLHAGDSAAGLAQLALTLAYNDAKGRTLAPISVAGNLGGMTLAPGLYKSTGSLEVSSGDLVLDAQGDANAVFIFQIASTLTTTGGRQVVLIGGAKAANIFWQVGTSATLGTTSVFKGTIMADQSISLNTGATLEGRALARIGGVTMDGNIITIPTP